MMKTYAYDELYVSLAQRNLGDMYDFAVNTLGYGLSKFHDMFLISGMAHQFEIGNPTYVAGKNGCEIARWVVEKCTGIEPPEDDVMYIDKSQEYWIGWALAYYQWHSGMSFVKINEGVQIEEMYGMYPTLHEADISLFIEVMDEKLLSGKRKSMLKRLREYARLSQRELADKSGVPLRQIQLFEQGQRDINKAQVQTLLMLSRTLGCDVETLCESKYEDS